MTPDQTAKAQSIIWRLFRKALKVEDNQEMLELVNTIKREYQAGNYGPFLAAAKRLNGIYEGMMRGEQEGWEH